MEEIYQRFRARNLEKAIQRKLMEARNRGAASVELRAGRLHDELAAGANLGANHRVPSICDAMWNAMKENDIVIRSPRRGRGRTLCISYCLA